MTALAQQSAAQRAFDAMTPDDYDDAAWEAREEYIEDNAQAIADALVNSDDFAWGVMAELSGDAAMYVLKAAGEFWTRYQRGATKEEESSAGYPLYRELRPYILDAAMEQARTDAGAAFDAMQADTPRSHAEASAMSEAA